MNFPNSFTLVAALAGSLTMLPGSQPVLAQQSLEPLRLQVLQAGVRGNSNADLLQRALRHPNVLIRHAAVRSLAATGIEARPRLLAVLQNETDELVRRTALRLTLELEPGRLQDVVEIAFRDPSPLVRLAAVEFLVGLKPYSKQVSGYLQIARQDQDNAISQTVVQALSPFQTAGFHWAAASVRMRPENKDYQRKTTATIPLPLTGWKFKTDASQTGHDLKWTEVGFDDSTWHDIAIGKAWEEQGHTYDGVAWYRLNFTLPERPEQIGTDLAFEAVDESAWVWVNGKFAGAHDVGTDGWDRPFQADVTTLLNWGGQNQITVRVLDRMMAGGIWQPVKLEVINK